MPSVKLRPSARALILDEDDRILLCKFEFVRDGGPVVVWAAPGGGVEPGETLLVALRRELDEEVGLALTADPPHVWHQQVVRAGHADGYDGVINDYFLVRTAAFSPRGSMTDEQLAAENVAGMRWWTLEELADYAGTDLFSPRSLPRLLPALLAGGLPEVPEVLGL
jgi:8-oxo-dGTP diphosphatase